jgi:hypothetical protein
VDHSLNSINVYKAATMWQTGNKTANRTWPLTLRPVSCQARKRAKERGNSTLRLVRYEKSKY